LRDSCIDIAASQRPPPLFLLPCVVLWRQTLPLFGKKTVSTV